MALIKKANTKPELIVRRTLHALGFRFRLHVKTLPGTPDIVLIGRRKVIFVHGCFWHRHDCRDGRKVPKSKPDYWKPKLERNRERDLEHLTRLRDERWKTLVIWECELGDHDAMKAKLIQFLAYDAN